MRPKLPISLLLSACVVFALSAQDVRWSDRKVGAPVPQTGTRQPLPRVDRVSAVAPDLICLEIVEGEILPVRQVRYTPHPADSLTVNRQTGLGEDYSVRVIRNGFPLGNLVGKNRDILSVHERLIGVALDTAFVGRTQSYTVRSASDPAFGRGVAPVAVYRKSKPTDWTEEERFGGMFHTARHFIYLRLPETMAPGHGYLIRTEGINLETTAFHFVFDPMLCRSEAVHVNQTGFRCDDPLKEAYLSCWAGTGGGVCYPEGLTFRLIDNVSHDTVFTGKTRMRWPAAREENVGVAPNHTKSDLFVMDFSEFRSPGSYRIAVDGIGCSHPFVVGPGAWNEAFYVAMKGLYHQRSGVEMLPPYTDFIRARDHHPDDGTKVYHSTAPYLCSGNGYNAEGTETNNFDTLVYGKTERIVPGAWGGVMDAGDWDRQIRHLKGTARKLLELAELRPEAFASLSLGIPESGNDLPDIVDEALFEIDVYRRMQCPDGGIRGGIECSEHPAEGCASWQDMLTVMAYAPDHVSSYIYAGVAARAAHVLTRYGCHLLAHTYLESALKAMRWGMKEERRWRSAPSHDRIRPGIEEAVAVEKNLAAAELYRVTGDPEWHDLFLSGFEENPARPEAAFLYARLDDRPTDSRVRKRAVDFIVREADALVERATGNAYGVTRGVKGGALGGWAGTFSAPGSEILVHAHALTHDDRYLRTLIRSMLFTLGANPMNQCLTTGLGANPILHPLHEDSRHTGQPAPVGITVCGPCELPVFAPYFVSFPERLARECTPSGMEWPTAESYFDIYGCDFQNEYVVDGHIGANAYIWGYLATRQ